MDIGDWLRDLGLERYESAFRENEVDARSLEFLTSDDLKEMGVAAIGHRRLLLNAIAQLSASDAVPPPQTELPRPSGAAQATAERRQLSVMFCDLVGSTQLAARLDPEEMRDIITAYQHRIADIVRRFDGYVAKYMGDGVLVYFGYPTAHEDDAERATRAALDIIAAMPELGAAGSETLRARIGIDTGLVVVGDLIGEGSSREESVVGNTPNLAARLQALATPDSVVVSGQTRRLLGETFTYEELESTQLKGFEGQQVGAFRVTGLSGFATRFEARGFAQGQSGESAMLGREPELAILSDGWEKARRSQGQAILLEGEAGVGKSRVISAFQRQIADQAHGVVLLQCAGHASNTEFFPLSEYFQRRMTVERGAEDVTKLEALIRVLAAAFDRIDEACPYIARMLDVPTGDRYPAMAGNPQQQRAATIGLLAEYFCRLASTRPILIVVEDAHWIDPTTQEFLDRLVPAIEARAITLLISFRPGTAHGWDGHGHVRRQVMGRLDAANALKMVEQIAGETVLPDAVKRQIVSRADGIPLFVEELTLAVLEADIEFDDAREPVLVAAIPASLQDSLMARLDRLGEARNVAQIAAALGRDFSKRLLAASMAISVDELEPLLEHLTDSGLIQHGPETGHETFRFKHALVRDVAYETLLKRRRRAVHASIARALELTIPSIAEVEPEVLAHHLTEAEDIGRAIDCWMRAGKRSYERSACKEAIHHITRALDLLDQQPPSVERDRLELSLQSDLGSSIMTVRGFAAPEVHRAFARAFDVCQTVGEGIDISRALRGLCWFYVSQSRLDMALELAQRLLDLAERNEDTGLVMVGCQSLGIVSLFLGKPAEAAASLRNGIGLYRSNQDRSLGYRYGVDPGANCLILYALSQWLLGYPDQARQRISEAESLIATMEHPLTTALTRSWIARIYAMFAAPEAALSAAEATIAYSRDQNIRLCEAEGSIVRGWARVATGASGDIGALADGIAMWRATGAQVVEPFYLFLLADAHLHLTDHAAATVVIDAAHTAVQTRGERWWAPEILRLKAEVLRARGDNGGADRQLVETSLTAALDLASSQKARLLELRAAVGLARFRKEAGQARDGHDLLRQRFDSFSEGFATEDLMTAERLLRELA